MGGGSWTTNSFADYTTSTKGMSYDTYTTSNTLRVQDIFSSHGIDEAMKPYQIVRECCDTDEHPETVPVILALDVTGSMGAGAVKVAQKLNQIMTDIYTNNSIKDVEFCVMGIGDVKYDHAPIQMSQFESDVRIAEWLDKIYFEHGGGGNSFESYTGAWYMGARHCKLDCWKRGKKGIIITMGDELPNPYIPGGQLAMLTGDNLQGDVETQDLLREVSEKFDVYHISIEDGSTSHSYYMNNAHLDVEWKKLLGEDHFFIAGLNDLPAKISNIIKECVDAPTPITSGIGVKENDNFEVIW